MVEKKTGKMKRRTIYIWVWMIVAAAICSALGLLAVYNPLSTKPVLTVSIQPQRYFLEKIVGDKFDVLCLLAQGSNPEAYEPSFSHLMNLEKSRAYFCMGNIGFELAILNRVKNNNPELQIIDTSEGIDYLRGTHAGVLEHSHGHKHSHSHEVDPHVWTSVVNAKIIAQNMYKAVLELDSHNKKYYTKNYNALLSELVELENEMNRELSAVKGEAFAVWHPSLSYFARDYGLTQIAMENEGKEVPAAVLKSEIDMARNHGVKVLFYQKEFDSRQIQTINEQLNAVMVEINPMSYEWAEEMRRITNALTGK